MQWCAAAKGNHGAGGNVTAAFNGVDARRIGHVLLNDFSDACRRPEAFKAQRIADGLLQSGYGTGLIELDFSAGKIGGVDLAQGQVGIGHGGFAAAAAIAHGAGGRSRRCRAPR